jgi:hypothetical protein
MNTSLIWDIEGEFDAATAALLDAQISTWSAQDKPVFQKGRDRVEVSSALGASNGHLAISETTGLEQDVEDEWAIAIRIELVTNSDPVAHGACRAAVRSIMARLPFLLNGKGLVNHAITDRVKSTGCTPMLKPESGYYHTVMLYATVIGIHQDAWAKP